MTKKPGGAEWPRHWHWSRVFEFGCSLNKEASFVALSDLEPDVTH